MFTESQIKEFADFCQRHEITFNNLAEYTAAIDQYFLEELQ